MEDYKYVYTYSGLSPTGRSSPIEKKKKKLKNVGLGWQKLLGNLKKQTLHFQVNLSNQEENNCVNVQQKYLEKNLLSMFKEFLFLQIYCDSLFHK